jgi:hypothetical protein
VPHEVVVIGEDRPRLQGPAEIASDGQQAAMQDGQPIRPAEMVQLQVGSHGDEVSAACGESVGGGVRPGGLVESTTTGGVRFGGHRRFVLSCHGQYPNQWSLRRLSESAWRERRVSIVPVWHRSRKPKRRQEDAAIQGAAFGRAGRRAGCAEAVYSNVSSPHVAG